MEQFTLRECSVCGGFFAPRRRDHRRCNTRCRVPDKSCLVCGIAIAVTTNRRYCGSVCQLAARRDRERDLARERMRLKTRRRVIECVCIECGVRWCWLPLALETYGRRPRRSFCSDEHRARGYVRRTAAWRQTRPDKVAFWNFNRRYRRKAQSVSNILERDMRRMMHRYRGECHYCGEVATTWDHLVPLARGGRHSIGNLVPACRPCNSRKWTRLVIEWSRIVAREKKVEAGGVAQ